MADDTDLPSDEDLEALDRHEGVEPDDDVEDDTDPEQDDEPVEPPRREASQEEPKKPSRSNSRIRALSEAAQRAERESKELRARLDQFEAQARQAQYQEDPRAEAARVAEMDPESRMQYQLDRASRQHNQQMQRVQFEMYDGRDRDEFRMLGMNDSRAKRYEAEVEAALGEARRAGMNPKREMLYHYILGRKVAQMRASGVAKQQKQEGQRRIASQKTQPSRSSGDVPSRGRAAKSLADKLDGVLI